MKRCKTIPREQLLGYSSESLLLESDPDEDPALLPDAELLLPLLELEP